MSGGPWKKNGALHSVIRVSDQAATSACSRTWLSAAKAGRTFGTSGPLLFLTVEGHEPGDEIRLSAEDSASPRVRVNVASIAPLDTVEVVVNGEIVHTWRPSGDGPNWELETTVNVPGSAWIAARATGPPSPYVGDIFPFAQTSPIYVVRDGRHFTSASDARFLLESVDELWRRVQERNSWTNEEQKRAYREGVEGARAAYRRVLLLYSYPKPAVDVREPRPFHRTAEDGELLPKSDIVESQLSRSSHTVSISSSVQAKSR